MTASRYYSSTAGQMFLAAPITASDTTITVTTAVGLPATTPYTLLLDPGLATEEIVECVSIGGVNLNVVRGKDGTSGQSHLSGAEVRHGFSARDFQDSRNHEGTGLGVHGITGVVVGTSDVQTLTNKTISGNTNTFTNVPISAIANAADINSVQTFTNKSIDANANTLLNVIPAGALMMFGAASAPAGWLACDGSSKSTTTYAALFAVIGYAYGGSGGSFNLPNFASAFPRGNGVASNGGSASHLHGLSSVTTAGHNHSETAHVHTLSDAGQAAVAFSNPALERRVGSQAWTPTHNMSVTSFTSTSTPTQSVGAGLLGNTDYGSGGTTGTSNEFLSGSTDTGSSLPPYIGVNFIIKT